MSIQAAAEYGDAGSLLALLAACALIAVLYVLTYWIERRRDQRRKRK